MAASGQRQALTFRRLEARDLPAVLELWESAGWGALDEATWREWYEDTPHGSAIVTVVEDEHGAIGGQFAMVPCEVAVSTRRVRGLRSSAVLLREDLIFRRDDDGGHEGHPLLGLPAVGFELARLDGFALVFTFPHRWALPILRGMGRYGVAAVQLETYACVELEAGGAFSQEALGKLVASPVQELTSEHEDLAQQTPGALGVECHVVRSLDWLRWRLGGNWLSEVRDDSGGLVAMSAVDPKNGLLSDVHVLDERYLDAALAAAAAHSQASRLKVMALPQLEAALDRLGGRTVDFDFSFACWSLDERLVRSDEIAPTSWFPMHAD